MNNVQEFRRVIQQRHGGRARHIGSVPVNELFGDGRVWDGIVEVFNLQRNPQANRVYAWLQVSGGNPRVEHCVTVLHIPPVVSPRAAVKAAIEQNLHFMTKGGQLKRKGMRSLER